jgi:very-short-patch-repair endonuclease
MTEHYNKKQMKERRRQLRSNMTFCEKIIWLHLRKYQLGVKFHR